MPQQCDIFFVDHRSLQFPKRPWGRPRKRTITQDLISPLPVLQDDRKFIEALKEAHIWDSSVFLQKLFVTMLLSSSMNILEHVWSNTWQDLSNGILYEKRVLTRNPDTYFMEIFSRICFNFENKYFYLHLFCFFYHRINTYW